MIGAASSKQTRSASCFLTCDGICDIFKVFVSLRVEVEFQAGEKYVSFSELNSIESTGSTEFVEVYFK